MLLYALLNGFLPFDDDHTPSLYRLIQVGSVNDSLGHWKLYFIIICTGRASVFGAPYIPMKHGGAHGISLSIHP